jgi:hypothetical protein
MAAPSRLSWLVALVGGSSTTPVTCPASSVTYQASIEVRDGDRDGVDFMDERGHVHAAQYRRSLAPHWPGRMLRQLTLELTAPTDLLKNLR